MGLPRWKKTAVILFGVILPFISALLIFNFFLLPDSLTIVEGSDLDNSSFVSVNASADGVGATAKAFGVLPIKNLEVNVVPGKKVYVSGTPIGIKLKSRGILITGYIGFLSKENIYVTPGRDSGFRIGDRILEINGKEVNDCDELISLIEESNKEEHTFTIERMGTIMKIVSKTCIDGQSGKMRLGLWIKDSAAGIGTLTFYDKKTGFFGALGHGISDNNTARIFEVSEGEMYKATILDITKGIPGCPGELKGCFTDTERVIGNVFVNSETGIFGIMSKEGFADIAGREMYIGSYNQVREGKAVILSTIGDGKPKEYEIEITKVNKTKVKSPKGIVLKITDKELLDATGGIVQGMSGSPIIQNGKLVGAVTHVMVNDPSTGYGIFIEGMLANYDLVYKEKESCLDLAS